MNFFDRTESKFTRITVALGPRWNPAVENQAIQRAHRIGKRLRMQDPEVSSGLAVRSGRSCFRELWSEAPAVRAPRTDGQKTAVRAVRFVMANTLEENMLTLQKKKQVLSSCAL